MKTKIMGAMAAATVLLSGCDFKQANPTCVIGHGDYIVKYVPVDPAADTCGLPGGEVLGLQRYAPNATAGARVAFRTQDGGLRGQSAFEGLLEEKENTDPQPWTEAWFDTFSRTFDLGDGTIGLGQFPQADEPDADGFCAVTDFGMVASASEAEFVAYDAANFELVEVKPDTFEWLPTDDATTEVVEGAQSVTYAFTNTKFYVSARSAGVTFRSELTYTSTIEAPGASSCTAKFTAVGMFPVANILGTPNFCDPDDATNAACDPCPFNADGQYTAGSGINPDLKTTCDANVFGGFCVLDGTELPGFLSDEEIKARSAECDARSSGG